MAAKEIKLDGISDKEVREVARWARDRHGCTFTKSTGGYVQVRDREGRRVCALPTTPSAGWRESKASEFRTAGLDDVGFPGLNRQASKELDASDGPPVLDALTGDGLRPLLESLEGDDARPLFSVEERDGMLQVRNPSFHFFARDGIAAQKQVDILMPDAELDAEQLATWREMVAEDLRTIGVDLTLPEAALRRDAAEQHRAERERTKDWPQRGGGRPATVQPVGEALSRASGRISRAGRRRNDGISL